MSRARRFSKAEIMDAARAAAETGLDAILSPAGEIHFLHERKQETIDPSSPEAVWEKWLNGRKASGHTHG